MCERTNQNRLGIRGVQTEEEYRAAALDSIRELMCFYFSKKACKLLVQKATLTLVVI